MLYRDRRRLHHAVLDDAVALEPTERPWSAQSAFNDRFTRIETRRRRAQRAQNQRRPLVSDLIDQGSTRERSQGGATWHVLQRAGDSRQPDAGRSSLGALRP